MAIMIDSNVILDVVTKDPVWFRWSSRMLKELANSNIFVINSIIYSEVSVGFERIEDVEELFCDLLYSRVDSLGSVLLSWQVFSPIPPKKGG